MVESDCDLASYEFFLFEIAQTDLNIFRMGTEHINDFGCTYSIPALYRLFESARETLLLRVRFTEP